MKTLLTIIVVSVILLPYFVIKFIMNPVGSIRVMIENWRFVNGDWNDITPAYTETKEKKAKRKSKSITG